MDEELADVAREWDATLDAQANDATRSALLARMNEILNRRSYIRNLVASVQKELESSGHLFTLSARRAGGRFEKRKWDAR